MINVQKLLRIIEAQRWWRFCWPDRLWVSYRVLPQFADRCTYKICFYINERHFCYGFYQKLGDEPDYKFAAKQFFRAYRRTRRMVTNDNIKNS